MILKTTFSLALVIFCATAGAQVYRCPDKVTGKITYSERQRKRKTIEKASESGRVADIVQKVAISQNRWGPERSCKD